MKRKNLILIAMALVLSLSMVACSQKEEQTTTQTTTEQTQTTDTNTEQQTTTQDTATETQELELTLEELAKYNGKDGNPAYIAVDGVIYDVTNSPAWKDGGHNGFEAGKDLTDAIKNQSPHGVSKLDGIPVVGKLVE